MAHHPDRRFKEYIVDGIRRGFRVGFNYAAASCHASGQNLPSVREQPQVVRDYLAQECALGRILGPLDPKLYPQVHTSRFGIIPKSTPGKWRLIVDLSSPRGKSVNDGIAEEVCSLSYVGIDEATSGILTYGRGALLAKVDIQSAYRNIPIHPEDRHLLGMLWDGALYIDTALPFGLRSAPKIFTAIADAAEWIARQQGIQFVIHYLDDYLIIGAPDCDECQKALTSLLEVFQRLGLPVAEEKLEGPCTCLKFLGFELDSKKMDVRLPHCKLQELKILLRQWQGKKSSTKKELESLVGKLAFASRVVKPGKTFLRRMFELLSGIRQPHHHVRLNGQFRSDLQWWVTFLSAWNGVSILEQHGCQRSSIHFATDASGCFGCGAVWGEVWFQLQWPQSYETHELKLKQESITFKEIVPIVIACAVWGPAWATKSVTVHCDNEGAVAVVNSGYSRIPPIMHMLRCLFFIRAYYQITLRAVHVPGRENDLADAISRNNLSVLFSQVPQAINGTVIVPPMLLSVVLEHQPDWTSVDWCQLFRNCLLLA